MPFLKKTIAALAVAIPMTLGVAHAAQEAPKEIPAAEEPKPKSPEDPLVKVNGSVITRADLDRAVKVLVAQSAGPAPIEGQALKQAQEVALQQLVDAELLYQEAAKRRIPNLERKVEQKLAEKRKEFATEEAFQQALKEIDLTKAGLSGLIRKDMVISNFIEDQFLNTTIVSDADIRTFYQENLERYFTREETVRASHILVAADKSAPAEERAKAKEKAAALLKKVREGADFAALAKAESSCPSSADGGDLGNFTRGKMVAEFDKAAFALKKGEVSDVVETQFGYHIIKITDRQEKGVQSFEEVKGAIAEHLKREIPQKALASFVDGLKKKAKIEKLEKI